MGNIYITIDMPKTRLWKMINDNFSHIIKQEKISILYKKTIVIDANNIIMANCIAYRKTGTEFTNKEGKSTSHIKAILDNATFYLRQDITPFYVFDGKAHSLKDDVIKKRREYKNKSKIKCANATNFDEYIKYYKRTVELSKDKIDDIKRILDYIGVPYIHALGEADPQIAAMTLQKEIYGAISEDIDILLFGGTKLIRRKKDKLVIIELKDILSEFSKYFGKHFTRENLADVVLLLGSEYAATVKNISTATLLGYYKLNGFDFVKSIINLKKDKHCIPKKLLSKWKEIKNYFLDPEIIDPKSISLQLSKPIKKDIYNFLIENGFNKDIIDKKYTIIYKKYKLNLDRLI